MSSFETSFTVVPHSMNLCSFITVRTHADLRYASMVKEIEISVEAYSLLEKARLQGWQ